MRVLVMGILVLSLGGCLVTDRESLVYTRSEVDAINAEAQCKQLARNLVQVSRCETRR